MSYLIAVISIIVGIFVWLNIEYKKQKKLNNKKEKPPFRTEEDLQEYGKPLKDDESSVVDFDDAE